MLREMTGNRQRRSPEMFGQRGEQGGERYRYDPTDYGYSWSDPQAWKSDFSDWKQGILAGDDPYFSSREEMRSHENAPQFKSPEWKGWISHLISGGDPAAFGTGGGGDASNPQYPGAPQAMTFPPTLPGFQGMLAQQLAQGFGSGGGTVPDFQGMLANMYQPMTAYRLHEPISTTAALYDSKKYAPIETGNIALDRLLLGKSVGSDKDDKKMKGRSR